MSIMQLKNEIKVLEATVINDRRNLREQRQLVAFRFNESKKTIMLSQIILGGFTLGYLLGPAKKSIHPKRRNFAGLIMFVKVKRWFNRLKSSQPA